MMTQDPNQLIQAIMRYLALNQPQPQQGPEMEQLGAVLQRLFGMPARGAFAGGDMNRAPAGPSGVPPPEAPRPREGRGDMNRIQPIGPQIPLTPQPLPSDVNRIQPVDSRPMETPTVKPPALPKPQPVKIQPVPTMGDDLNRRKEYPNG